MYEVLFDYQPRQEPNILKPERTGMATLTMAASFGLTRQGLEIRQKQSIRAARRAAERLGITAADHLEDPGEQGGHRREGSFGSD